VVEHFLGKEEVVSSTDEINSSDKLRAVLRSVFNTTAMRLEKKLL
jgi:hypothetical protein